MVEKKIEVAPHPDNHEPHEVRRIWTDNMDYYRDIAKMTQEDFRKMMHGTWAAE